MGRYGIEEVRAAALQKVKSAMSCGFNDIPVETLQNETAITFLHKLFHNCFEEGITLYSKKGSFNLYP